ncbi:MAG: alpha/beta hydrolase [Candidatus Bathyarchaeota archaeon]|nr:alpha/beta hydrolase [Candidatus Bathyarchaeota archaeon]
MKEGFLDACGHKIHHVMWGDSGPKILLIHSMGMDGHSMDELAESLKKDHEVLSLTILDHGDSDPPKSPMTLVEHAEVMRDCYRQLDFYPSVLIGHSVGGMMGMTLTSIYPDEFKGLVLVDIAPFESTGRTSRPVPPDSFKDEAEARDWLKERYPGFTPGYYDNRIKYAFKEHDGKLVLKPRGDKVRGGLALDLWPYVEKITTPTLLLAGKESDLVTPETRKRMEKSMIDIDVVVVKGTGHMIPQDKPEEFEELVRRFLKKL